MIFTGEHFRFSVFFSPSLALAVGSAMDTSTGFPPGRLRRGRRSVSLELLPVSLSVH